MAKRLYIGNLPDRITEDEVKTLFLDNNININLETENILLKQGYAFVDCEDQSAVDSAIEKLSGKYLAQCIFIFVVQYIDYIHIHIAVTSPSRRSTNSNCKSLNVIEWT